MVPGKICVWDSIVGGGRGTGLLPLIFFSPYPPSENFYSVQESRCAPGVLFPVLIVRSYSPERVTTHVHTNPYNGDF